MANILKGGPVAEAINNEIHQEVSALKAIGVTPTLAIVRVGEKQDDIAYERSAAKRCENNGVAVKQIIIKEDCEQPDIITEIKSLNNDKSVHGILLLRPLPGHIDDLKVRNSILHEKDIDGVTDLSLAGVFTGSKKGFAPCTAQACIEILDYYGISLKGKRAAVIGRSLVVGKPVAMMLTGKDATVTICHTKTTDMERLCRQAQILIVSAGRAKIIKDEFLSPEQIVIDVGINPCENGSICGDVDFEQASRIVSGITPVPGGVGTVTTSVLVKHVVMAAKSFAKEAVL